MTVKFNNNRELFEELNRKESLSIDKDDFLVLEYPDHFSSNGNKKVNSKDLGKKFAHLNSFFFDYLKGYHIPTAFIKSDGKKSLKFLKHNRCPFVIKILNTVDKRTSKIFHKKENEHLSFPIFEYHIGEGKDSLVTESHLISFNLCSIEELKLMNRICSKVNAVLKSFFERRNTILAEVSCCFGRHDNKIYLVDDFTPRSLKILPVKEDKKWSNPHKLTTAAEVKRYTDQLQNIMSS
ncbi:MAG: phosphoribosylaminoimidazolesuccinocarboxamide synthase [Ignavibacteriaceae bacterium]